MRIHSAVHILNDIKRLDKYGNVKQTGQLRIDEMSFLPVEKDTKANLKVKFMNCWNLLFLR